MADFATGTTVSSGWLNSDVPPEHHDHIIQSPTDINMIRLIPPPPMLTDWGLYKIMLLDYLLCFSKGHYGITSTRCLNGSETFICD